MVVPVGIALGSNLGNRSEELNRGIEFLRTLSANRKVRESARLETTPVDCPTDSPPFLNSVAEIHVDTMDFPPLNLFGCLEDFEIERGRSPIRDVNSPRPLDLDIIYYGAVKFDDMGLIIPHPRAHKRRFVLEPLAQLRPDLILPGQTKTVQQLLDLLPEVIASRR
jgi:2-amino-4-hydroxy-6-hydroxymethyldihydropteridine diphosphokinase